MDPGEQLTRKVSPSNGISKAASGIHRCALIASRDTDSCKSGESQGTTYEQWAELRAKSLSLSWVETNTKGKKSRICEKVPRKLLEIRTLE